MWSGTGKFNSYFYTDFASHIWYAVARWFGITMVSPPNIFFFFSTLIWFGSSKKIKSFDDKVTAFLKIKC